MTCREREIDQCRHDDTADRCADWYQRCRWAAKGTYGEFSFEFEPDHEEEDGEQAIRSPGAE